MAEQSAERAAGVRPAAAEDVAHKGSPVVAQAVVEVGTGAPDKTQ
jgi:hypothetical protein